MDIDLPWLGEIGRPKAPARAPVVLSREDVARLLTNIDDSCSTIAALLYGAGLRLMECLRLRVKDIDFKRRIIIVREGKGRKDRVVMLPEPARSALQTQIGYSRAIWMQDRAHQVPGVCLPDPWRENIPERLRVGRGIGRSPLLACLSIRDPRYVDDTISMSKRSGARSLEL